MIKALRYCIVLGLLWATTPAWAEANYGCPATLAVSITGTPPADLKGATATAQAETLKLANVTSTDKQLFCHYNQTGSAGSPAWKLLTLDRPVAGKCPAPGTYLSTAEGTRECYVRPLCAQGELVTLPAPNEAVCSAAQPSGATETKCNVCCVPGAKAGEGAVVACTGSKGAGAATAFQCPSGFKPNSLYCVPK